MHFLAPQAFWWAFALLGAGASFIAWARQCQMLRSWYRSKGESRAPAGVTNEIRFGDSLPPRRFAIKGVVVFVAVAACVLALARPSMPDNHVQFSAGSVDIVVLLDVSRSMAAQDCKGATRIATARSIIAEAILPTLKGNRIGIISYAGKADPKVFLTYELSTAYWLAENELKISSAPGEGSALSEAFDFAFRYFDVDSDPERLKMIVVLSDGGTDDNTNLAAIAEGCRKRRINVVAVGTGTPTPALIPVSELGEDDRRKATDRFYKNFKTVGNQVTEETALTGLDVPMLTDLVRQCGQQATFVQVTSPSDFQFKPLAAPLKPQEKPGEKELFFWFTLLFFLAVALSVVATADLRRFFKSRGLLFNERTGP